MVDTKSPDEVQKQVDQFRMWIDAQGHFPKNLEDKFLRRFLHSCYYDMEKARSAIDLFFSIRTSAPELLNNRDPLSPSIQKFLKIVNLAQYKISENRNLWIWQLNDPGLEQYDYVQDARLFFLTTDVWLLDDDQELEDSDIVILDVKDITLKFITKFNISAARKLSKYQEDAIPIRIKQIHVINTPPFIDKLYALMKPFLKQDMTNMIHFHTPNSNTLYQYLSKDDLPEDFGGTRGTMAEYMEKLLALLKEKRKYFLDDNLWRSEKKSKNKSENSTDIGSFRSLAID